MSTQAKCGTTGSVGDFAEITAWTLNLNQAAIDVSSMGLGYRSYVGCLLDADGTISTVVPCGGVGAKAGLKLETSDSSYTFDAILSSVKVDVDVKGVARYDYTFYSTGTLA